MRVNEITTSGELESLSGEWSELWERCPGATPFQTPEWLLPWWRRLGRGRLRTLVVREEGRLVGLAPLLQTGLPLRRLCLLGTGNTDYLDFLVERECGAAAEALGRYLEANAATVGLCDMQQIPPGAAVWKCGSVEDAKAVPGRVERMLQETCPFLTLPESVEAWWDGLPGKLCSNLRYYRRRLEREGALIDTATEATVDELLAALFRLHAARWRRRGLPGVFANARVRAFHREVAAGFLRRGWLRLYGLRFRGAVCAALYCFAARGKTYYYGGGFDPALGRLSLGTVLTGHAIEAAVREGCSEFDFLRGDEPYKYGWGAVNRVNHRLVLSGSQAALHLVQAEQRLETWGKQAVRRWCR